MLVNKGISVSYFFSVIKYDLMTITAYAVVIGLLDNYSIFKSFGIPLQLTAILGTAVSLLLAFRTNQSYERWWEARIVWGSIVNDSRTLIRQIQTFYDGPDKTIVAKDFATRQIKWCQSLTTSLRRQSLAGEVAQYFSDDVVRSTNVPNAILSIHSEIIQKAFLQGHINQFQQIQLDNTIVNLCNAMGRCERIKTTVFPKSYSLLIHFIIYIFATALPFGLQDDNILLEVFLCVLIPAILISIERTSILMQDPFENLPLDTPMTTISRTIESNLTEMTGDVPVPVIPVKPEEYYVL